MQVTCPGCLAVNRVDPARVDAHPTCGVCKSALFPGTPVELSTDRFDAYVGRTQLPVVVDFWAAWCGPCKAMAPHFAHVARDLAGRVQFAKVDTDRETALAQRYGIRSIPTLLLFRDGKEADRVAGAMGTEDLKRWLLVR